MWTIRIIAHIFISPSITLTKPQSPKIYQVDLYYLDWLQIHCVTLGYSALMILFPYSKVKFVVQIFFGVGGAHWHFTLKSSQDDKQQRKAHGRSVVPTCYSIQWPFVSFQTVTSLWPASTDSYLASWGWLRTHPSHASKLAPSLQSQRLPGKVYSPWIQVSSNLNLINSSIEKCSECQYITIPRQDMCCWGCFYKFRERIRG